MNWSLKKKWPTIEKTFNRLRLEGAHAQFLWQIRRVKNKGKGSGRRGKGAPGRGAVKLREPIAPKSLVTSLVKSRESNQLIQSKMGV